ncbi:hypothetical protein [Staphylococcus kloosii]|jgi:hypothetical protein|uniref:hypothetical protein n=1 Tax=Staphylococcus kloosii TaxID=29384 RepID=UPI00189F3743|nr:hypothetical protein [Staphylococcus kloosii]MBF7025077.1 hypothetical protein [Staphylococcus kloosii]
MITKGIKFPNTKFIIDCIGVLASIGILIVFVFNAYASFSANGSSEFGINIAGNQFILLSILFAITVVSALSSFVLKRIK